MLADSPEQIISSVKSIVSEEIASLDSGVEISYTEYFNHTYMPDMVLSWPRQNEVRPLYLRSSFREGVTESEVRGLEGTEPVVLGLQSATEGGVEDTIRESARSTRRVFVTDIGSIDSFGRAGAVKGGQSTPLVEVLKSNLFRAGRGFMGSEDVTTLTEAAERAVSSDPEVSASGLRDLEEAASGIYAEDGAYQIGRVGRILQAAGTSMSIQSQLELEGRLSESDIRIVLPYLLRRPDVSDNLEFWSAISRLVDLESLENVIELEGLDITRLVNPDSLKSWSACRAELALNNDFDEEFDSADVTRWSIRAGKLSAITGPWNLVFASTDKRKLKGASDAREANWDDIARIARALIVESASLRGITRRLSVGAEESSNVVRDVDEITRALEDNYRVRKLDVRTPGSESDSVIDVDFKKMLATVHGSGAPLGELGTVALLLLGHRYQVSPGWLEVELPDEVGDKD
ncbi:hypothetical protein KUG88_28325 [Rhodococcus rhodochrous]|uniref:hypothetical protein n=1 Tax=Rhodococcus rhodochrous TaxID=1829 RepID=UPI001E54CAEA|nr:hypothetical protein [Rhodococcus rhodochrous]MCB8914010.1 hypothetical protein [Rhodococcus rhodochrous]